MGDKAAKYRTEIQQMMFVSGETTEPSIDTTTMIEEIVQNQVKEMLIRASESANRRGVRTISIDDLMFLIRHDKPKVSRLQSFLSWKDVRKTAKDSDEKPGGGDDFANGPDDATAAAGSGASADMAARGMNRNRRTKVKLPWDVSSFYNVQLPERDEEGEDEEEAEMTSATLERLKNADERTRDMTREEYVHWSECRQASFTFKKAKRFREWAGFGGVTDSKPNDDVVDILGFLTFEIVQTITEESLKVKAEEDEWTKVDGAKNGRDAAKGVNKRPLADDGEEEDGEDSSAFRRRGDGAMGMGIGMGLFDAPNDERMPVQRRHVQEAFRRTQAPPRKMRALGNFGRTPVRQPLRLI
ncbi:MAG: Transcription initiation protein spt3 [Chrysothrix sp. TS-e1954]|nr:MAG: Transcription initiation protein spt3 [Chrysothrix sp. TS-e1954]